MEHCLGDGIGSGETNAKTALREFKALRSSSERGHVENDARLVRIRQRRPGALTPGQPSPSDRLSPSSIDLSSGADDG
jgi:hypothetical protein